jgi:titin
VVATVGVNVQTVSDNGLTALTQECYQVRAIRVSRSGSSYSAFSNTACTTTLAPPIPGAVWGAYNSESSGGTAILTWVDNSNNEDGFRIYRSSEDGVVLNLAGTVGANTTSWLTDQPDCYRVVAFNAGGEAPPSPVACTRPAAPTNLTMSIDGVLTWTDNSSIETAYEVWYYWYSPCCGGGCEQGAYEYMVAELPANSTSFGTGYTPVPDCQRDGFYVVAKRGSYSSDAAGVDLP